MVFGIWFLLARNVILGEFGKFGLLADIKFLEDLEYRNNYLIFSHDPLKQFLIKQTGNNINSRRKFLSENLKKATEVLIHATWKPKLIIT